MKEITRLEPGLIHYYWGYGRGKTSTLIGTIIRALGHNLKPILIQFLKLHDESATHSGFFIGEVNYFKDIIPIKQFGGYNFIMSPQSATEDDYERAQNGLQFAQKIVQSGKYDLVALDEIVDTIPLKLIELEDLIHLLEKKPDHVEIIMTGHVKYDDLIDLSHYVTEYKPIQHPYYLGYDARPGIEF